MVIRIKNSPNCKGYVLVICIKEGSIAFWAANGLGQHRIFALNSSFTLLVTCTNSKYCLLAIFTNYLKMRINIAY